MITAIALFSAIFLILWLSSSLAVVRKNHRRKVIQRHLHALLSEENPGKIRKSRRNPNRFLLDEWINLSQTVIPDTAERIRIRSFFFNTKTDLYWMRRLRSRHVFTRSQAAHYLGYIETDRAKRALAAALKLEKTESVKLYLISALARLEAASALPDIIDTIKGGSTRFIMQVAGLLLDFQSSFIALFPLLETRTESEVRHLMVEYARLAPFKIFSPYLFTVFQDHSQHAELRMKAFSCLLDSYPFSINPAEYLADPNPAIAEKAYAALAERPGKANALILLQHIQKSTNRELAERSLSEMVKKSNDVFLFLDGRMEQMTKPAELKILYQALSARLDYYFLNTQSIEAKRKAEDIITAVLQTGKISEIISFLNANNIDEIENSIISIIRKNLRSDVPWMNELEEYLPLTILQKIGIPKKRQEPKRRGANKEQVPKKPLVIILAGISLIPPLLILVAYNSGSVSIIEAVAAAARNYLYFFSFYSIGITTIYFLLTALAYREARHQKRFMDIKDTSFLFSKNMLPSISILAPAYNEQSGIITSIESLRHVVYPDASIIVINDGSTDGTLQTLITHFSLERYSADYQQPLKTQPIRGIYRNKNIPELVVIDKVNGGKADSLNAGINRAEGEYILGIDSDSLIDRDALLSLTAAFLDEKKLVVASGGNIMPVNGCTISKGEIITRRVPKKPLPLFQTIEYLRSFLNGRLGWAHIRSLMIISGAFGLFLREQAIRIGGYLTSTERYGKDTVGEDMELVVHLARDLKERKEPFRILYNARATCWTEVPVTFSILKRQRERWQRGLIDILSFHRRMMANPRYGSYGLIGFPYYLIFEVIGPWLEFFGLAVFILAVSAGFANQALIKLVISANILYSFALSITAVYTSDRQERIFPLRDRLLLLFTSLVENFGFRQIVSFFRISGFISILRNVSGWGTMTRTGFKTTRSKR